MEETHANVLQQIIPQGRGCYRKNISFPFPLIILADMSTIPMIYSI